MKQYKIITIGMSLLLLNSCILKKKLNAGNTSSDMTSSITVVDNSENTTFSSNLVESSTNNIIPQQNISYNTNNKNKVVSQEKTNVSSQTIKDTINDPKKLNVELIGGDSTRIFEIMGKEYQSGGCRDIDIAKAKDYYLKAIKNNSAMAMNNLGKIYLKETGDKRNQEAAFQLFEKGAALNYSPAIVNLAHMYKNETSVKQDFRKAYELYKNAADLNNINGIYWTGYLTYKGLGTQQDYQQAIEYFQNGASRNESRCIYMLGSCYMHGYGVTQDFEKAKEMFNKALKRGNDHAVYAAMYHTIDSVKSHPHFLIPSLPAIMPQPVNTKDIDSVTGRWVGKLYTYDWSHRIVEGSTNMILELKKVNGELYGTWVGKNQKIIDFSATTDATSWKIKNTSTSKDKNAYFDLSSIICKINQHNDSIYITGNLERIERKEKEPLRPTYFILYKDKSEDKTQESTFTINSIYPNPIGNQLHIEFTVLKKDDITFKIDNQSGILCFIYKTKTYLPGNYSITLSPSLVSGSYSLIAYGIQYKLSQTLIKK
jgi:tetratricopeptide (TPR) repeat protein